MQSGLYIIFEGADGTGKTTTMRLVARKISEMLDDPTFRAPKPKLRLTHHPGCTPLGQYIRTLVKNPETVLGPNVEIDPLSRQMLYMVDKVSFTKTILLPALERGEWVFADRSNLISAIVYGSTEGISIDEIQRLHALIPPQRADRLYILRCPTEVAEERITHSRHGKDYFDDKSLEFRRSIAKTYDNLLTGSPEILMALTRTVAFEDVIYIDSSGTIESIVNDIADDLLSLAKSQIIAEE